MTEEALQRLLNEMSLEEKINQMFLFSGHLLRTEDEGIVTGPLMDMGITDENIRLAGGSLGRKGAEKLKQYQKRAMEEHPHKIPHLFMMDIINGFRTIFPIPLGQGASFEPELSKRCAEVAAKEASVSGIHVTFSPMADLVRDPRWGRVMESTGEDQWLNGKFVRAMVEGYQGNSVGEQYKMVACIKHFAAYGGAEAGRDYNTVQLTEHTLREAYLPAYQEGIEAGAEMVMTSFNTVNDIPATTNRWLMRDVLRGDMGFEGVLISDHAAIAETVDHGYSENEADAAKKALEAGVDIDLMTNCYFGHLKELVEKGEVDGALIDESVWRILRLKNQLELFENPFKDANEEKEKEFLLCPEHRELAREAAVKSFVLLKNEGILPLEKKQKIAFIGPYTETHKIMGSWSVTGYQKDTVTIRQAAEEVLDLEQVTFHQGCMMYRPEEIFARFCPEETEYLTEVEQEQLLAESIEAAKAADVVVMPIGESYLQSGEAMSRAMIDVPELQMELFRKIYEVNENIVVVLFSGRPLDLRELSLKAKAILEVWFPGTEGGHAVLDVLTGRKAPSGKVPMSFPYCSGQIPVYYNEYKTGRPYTGREGEDIRYRSKYLDIPNAALYPFGYGLTYTSFRLSPIRLDRREITKETSIVVSVEIENTGEREGIETVQLYLQDVTASVVRPGRELKGCEKIALLPGEKKKVFFVIHEKDLRFVLPDGTWGSEPGTFRVYVGTDSTVEEYEEFILTK